MGFAENLAFDRKYRPDSLATYVGNSMLKKQAVGAINASVRPQVFLLTGDAGCGKTTFARILCKEYLCENRDAEKGACGTCPSCVSLEEYIRTGDTSMLDSVHEYNIGEANTKDSILNIINEMMQPTWEGEWRCFIFDEVHKASDAAQSSLLKLVEEPPERVLIILCTNLPELLLPALRTRAQVKLAVTKPKVGELAGILKKICDAEDIDYDMKGLSLIANRSDCVIREAMHSLKNIASTMGNAKYDSAVEMFDEVADQVLANFYKLLFGSVVYDSTGKVQRDKYGNAKRKRDIMGYVHLLYDIRTQSNLETFMKNLIDFTKRGIYCINNVAIDGISDGELDVYKRIFGDFSVAQISLLLSKLIDLSNTSGSNLEAELLELGYKGISVIPEESPIGEDANANFMADLMSGLADINNELTLESQGEARCRELRESKLQEEANAFADTLMSTADIDDIQQMFGAVSMTDDND